jgi:prepilin-type N-terminal cleavage/methylation domain-containing protein/prepilin-type processing-associated H-X9-DG protein
MSRRRVLSPGSGCGRRGFTLVELLVVIAIIGTLIGLLLPAVNAVRERGRSAQCMNNMHQIVEAMANYESSNRTLPPGRMGCDAYTNSPCGPASGAGAMTGSQRQGTSGFMAVLPQLDQNPLYSNFAPFPLGIAYPAVSDTSTTNWSTFIASGGSQTVAQSLLVQPKVFVCPSDAFCQPANTFLAPSAATTSYAMMLGELGVLAVTNSAGQTLQPPATTELQQAYYNNGPFIYKLARRTADVRDGLQYTIFIGETIDGSNEATLNAWPVAIAYLSCLRSSNNPLNTASGSGGQQTISPCGIANLPSNATGGFASRHPSGANFAFGDGHMSYLSNQIDFPTYQALSTIAGSEAIDDSLLTP